MMRRPDRLAGLSSAWDAAKSSRRLVSPARAWGIKLRSLPRMGSRGRGPDDPRPVAGVISKALRPTVAQRREITSSTEFFVRDLEPWGQGEYCIHNVSQRQV